MIPYQPFHRVGHQGAEGHGVTLGCPPDGREERVDNASGEAEGQQTAAAEVVQLLEIGIEAVVEQGGDVGIILVLGGKGGKGGKETVGEGLGIETVEELFVSKMIIVMEHGAYVLRHPFLEVVFEEAAADVVARPLVAEDEAGGDTSPCDGRAVVVAEVAARAQDAHHALARAAEGAAGT